MPFADRTPADFERLRRDVAIFRDEYIAHLNTTLSRDEAPTYDAARKRLQGLAVKAGRAVEVSGVKFALLPPPMFGGPPLVGIAAAAFAHEDKRWGANQISMTGGRYKPSYEMIIDALDAADTILEEQADDVRRRRRNPLYWGDRILRAILGFPAYLISLVAGFDLGQLSPERARVLWVLSVVADIATVFAAGRALRWW